MRLFTFIEDILTPRYLQSSKTTTPQYKGRVARPAGPRARHSSALAQHRGACHADRTSSCSAAGYSQVEPLYTHTRVIERLEGSA